MIPLPIGFISRIRDMALPVLRHRVLCNYFAESDNMTVDDVLNGMLKEVQE